ncbi:MAG: ABC transporter permease [Bacteroidia bacterium]|nr:ABC transporter permease [Bacteroidia bacterium]MCZ2278279.1 ABC transporter permease [Bacteroidia bacterium]
MKYIFSIGHYWIFLTRLVQKPERFNVYLRQIFIEMEAMGFGSLGIVAVNSIFMGAVITIQSAYNIVNPLVPLSAIGVVARDSMILEFSPTVIMMVLAGKIGSSIASEIGTMRVTEQIDAIEIMGINSSGFLVLPKIIASTFILPFVVLISMFVGIMGGWLAGDLTGACPAPDYLKGLQDSFVPFNVTFALIKTVIFAFIITSVSSYQGYFTRGGALEVGQASTRAVVYSNILILLFDYICTQLLLV